jgi:hypothetical protein
MRSIHAVGLLAILLIAACGQAADLSSPTSAELPSTAGATVSATSQTVAANVRPIPCPTFAVYPAPLLGETATPTNTPPPPTPTVDPEAVPTATAPGELGSITLPNDDATIRAIFAALPETIGDYRRARVINQEPYSFSAWYQHRDLDPSAVRPGIQPGLSLSTSSNPNEKLMFPGSFIAPYSDYWRRDGQVFYGYYERRSPEPLDDQYQNCNEVRSTSLTFVAPKSTWLFRAEAPTREELEPLIAAFVQVVKASPPPIPYSPPTPYPTPDMTAMTLRYPRPNDPVPGSSNPMYPPPHHDTPPSAPAATPTTTTTAVP